MAGRSTLANCAGKDKQPSSNTNISSDVISKPTIKEDAIFDIAIQYNQNNCAINDGIFTRVHQKFHVRYTGDWKDPLKLLKAVKNFEGQIRMVLKNDQERLNLLDKMLEICEGSKNAGGRFGNTKLSFVLARALDVPLCTGNEAYLASDGGENGYYGICEACGEEVYGFMSAD